MIRPEEDLADRLGSFDDLDEHTFTAYGLDEQQIAELRRWAVAWGSDLRERIAAGEDAPPQTPDSVWDSNLDDEGVR